jgi:hypothetical protein
LNTDHRKVKGERENSHRVARKKLTLFSRLPFFSESFSFPESVKFTEREDVLKISGLGPRTLVPTVLSKMLRKQ